MANDKIEFGNLYLLRNSANNDELFFREEENYIYFLKLMKKYLIPIADIYSFCLLPKNFAMLVYFSPDKASRLTEGTVKPAHQYLANFFNAYAKAYNKRYKRRGSLFKEHFARKSFDEINELKKCIAEVHRLPLIENPQANFEDYKFSSYRIFLSNKDTSLSRTEVLSWFGTVENFVVAHRNLNI